MGCSFWDNRRSGPGLERRKGVLKVERPLGVGEIGSIVLVLGSAWSGELMAGIVVRRQSDRDRREKLPLFSEAEESASEILGISNGIVGFPLGA